MEIKAHVNKKHARAHTHTNTRTRAHTPTCDGRGTLFQVQVEPSVSKGGGAHWTLISTEGRASKSRVPLILPSGWPELSREDGTRTQRA